MRAERSSAGGSDIPMRDQALWRPIMVDITLLAVGVGFLVVAVLYTLACDRL
jgi:hypothetical protein